MKDELFQIKSSVRPLLLETENLLVHSFVKYPTMHISEKNKS